MVKLVNRARMTTPSTGTGVITLGVALNGFQSFAAAGVVDGDVVRYLLEEGEAWELGIGTYSASGTTLTRSVTESSSGANLISLTGTATVSLVLTAADLDIKAALTDPRLTDAREWTASTITQAEAEAGTATTRRAFTAQRIRQAILAWWAGSADKTKLDGIAAGAQVNTVTSVAGKTGAVTLSAADVGSASISHSHAAATTSAAGFMTATDKSKLDGVAAGAQVNVPTNLGITGTGNSRTITSSTGINVTIPVATSSTAGLMATSDKSKLDGIAAGAQVNSVASVAGKTGAVTLSAADVGAAGTSHSHGSLTSDGRIGSSANLVVVTGTSGALTTKAAGSTSQYLRGDGNWATPPNTTYAEISTAEIDAGTASTQRTITGRRMGYALGKKADLAHSHAAASTVAAGFMSATDKTKLNGIAAGAQVNTVTSVAGRTGAVTLGIADVAGAFPASALPAGTRMLFAQSSAPLGWTKDFSHNNKALRVVSGTAGSGGSVGFATAFAERAVNGTIGSTAAGGTVHHHSLSWHEMPAHSHEHVHLQAMNGFGVSGNHYVFGRYIATNGDGRSLPAHYTGQSGSSWGHSHGFTGQSHNHNFTGTAIDLAVAYVDIIIARKD